MTKRIWFSLLFAFFSLSSLYSQQSFTISGTVRDGATGEQLIGVSVVEKTLKKGTVTNEYGFYSLSLNAGNAVLVFNYLGFEEKSIPLKLNKNISFNLELKESSEQLQEIVVTESSLENQVRSTQMSVSKLQAKEIKKMPQLLGEVDIIRTLTLLPGVSTVGEGSSGFNVRGGNIDQNLILGDEAPVFNSSHLAGFFSVFNADVVKEIKLYKGGIPAQYGGRLSSVLDIRLKEGNSKHFSGTGGLGLLSSRLLLEGPIIDDKLSWLIAGRRSYADLFIRLSPDETINQNILYFYDLNGKLNYKINEKNTLYLSGYYGRDVFGIQDAFGFDWGNTTATLRWNSILTNKLFANFTMVYSDYLYTLGTPEEQEFQFKWNSRIQNYVSSADFTLYRTPESKIKFGLSNTYYLFDPARITGSVSAELQEQKAIEPSIYISSEQKISNRLTLDYGLRFGAFFRMGPFTESLYRDGESLEDSSVIGTRDYASGQAIASFLNLEGLEPRIAANYLIDEVQSIKASYNRTRQYIHLISNTTATTPIDIWRPSSTYIEPAIADQVALGYFRNIEIYKQKYELSAEIYYKEMRNVLDYKDGADLIFKENIETELIAGQGRAYGLELLLRKNTGRLTGWIGYTLSRTERLVDGQFTGEQINNGDWFASNYDKTHDLSIVANYQINQKWDIGMVWVFQTGRPITYPSARGEYEGIVFPVYDNRNGARVPNYHRLDFSANYTKEKKPQGKWESSWAFGIYNVYARRNPYSVFFQEAALQTNITEAVQLSIFGTFIPSVTYNFNF